MPTLNYHERSAFPPYYKNDEEDFFRDLKEELNIWGTMGGDKRITEVKDPIEYGSKNWPHEHYDFENQGHFLRVKILEDHNRYWDWPITDRGLAFISSLQGEETVIDVLKNEKPSHIITVAKTGKDGRVIYPFETTNTPDNKTREYLSPDEDQPYI